MERLALDNKILNNMQIKTQLNMNPIPKYTLFEN